MNTAETITVRQAEPEDKEKVDALDALATATLRKTYRPKETVRRQNGIPHSTATRLVAVAENRIIGTVMYRMEDDRVHVFRLGVHPEFRRQGIARVLLTTVEEMAGDIGVRCVSLYAVKETGNVTIFERLGFKVIREEEDQYIESDKYDKLIDVYMEKVLG